MKYTDGSSRPACGFHSARLFLTPRVPSPVAIISPGHLPVCPPLKWKSAPVIGHNGSAAVVTWHFISESMEAAAAPRRC